MAIEHNCPSCQRPLTYLRDWPFEERPSAPSKFAVALASALYECPEHGQFRIYISGRVESVKKIEGPS